MCRLSLFGARISFHRSESTLGFAPFPWSVSVKKLFKIHTQQSFWTWKENIPSRIAKGRRTSEPMIFKVRAEVLDSKFDQWYATKSCVAWCNVGYILITGLQGWNLLVFPATATIELLDKLTNPLIPSFTRLIWRNMNAHWIGSGLGLDDSLNFSARQLNWSALASPEVLWTHLKP